MGSGCECPCHENICSTTSYSLSAKAHTYGYFFLKCSKDVSYYKRNGDWWDIMKNNFALHGPLSWFEHPQHFLQINVLIKGQPLKKYFLFKKNSAFLVLQFSRTLKYSVSCNLELHGNSFICVISDFESSFSSLQS